VSQDNLIHHPLEIILANPEILEEKTLATGQDCKGNNEIPQHHWWIPVFKYKLFGIHKQSKLRGHKNTLTVLFETGFLRSRIPNDFALANIFLLTPFGKAF
jgi:hypothetical protein